MFDLEKPDTREAYVAQWFPWVELQKSGVMQGLATNDVLLRLILDTPLNAAPTAARCASTSRRTPTTATG